MAVRSNRRVKIRSILLAPGVNPVYEQVAAAIAGSQGLTFERLPDDCAPATSHSIVADGRDPSPSSCSSHHSRARLRMSIA